jgi:prevent-host-death family protein
METIGAYEAKTHLPKLLDRVVKGERFLITKHGVPVAVLQPPDFKTIRDPVEAIAAMREFGKKRSLKGLSIKEMIEKGRK